MVTCDSAWSLIAREPEGGLSAGELGALDDHAAACPDCRALREANVAAKAVLAMRRDAPVPDGFVARVIARTHADTPGAWIDAFDWRRWTEWMVPVAAALALVAILAGSSQQPGQWEGTGGDVSATEATATVDEETNVSGQALSPDATSEELLAAMLGTGATGSEVTRDGR